MSRVAAFGFVISKTDMQKDETFSPEDFDYKILQHEDLLFLKTLRLWVNFTLAKCGLEEMI